MQLGSAVRTTGYSGITIIKAINALLKIGGDVLAGVITVRLTTVKCQYCSEVIQTISIKASLKVVYYTCPAKRTAEYYGVNTSTNTIVADRQVRSDVLAEVIRGGPITYSAIGFSEGLEIFWNTRRIVVLQLRPARGTADVDVTNSKAIEALLKVSTDQAVINDRTITQYVV